MSTRPSVHRSALNEAAMSALTAKPGIGSRLLFGHIKQARGFRQFLLRGIDKVTSEWAMICNAHNLEKLVRSRATAAA